MIVTHVLIGKSEPIAAKSGLTGINKRPQSGPVRADIYGLENDAIVDTDNHGGRDQAVYIFGDKDYAFWENELGRSLGPGTFGENLILSDFSTHDISIGDEIEIGEVRLEATFPRIPCTTLAARMNDPDFPNGFSKTGHVGVYTRVLTPGLLEADTPATLIRKDGASILSILPGHRMS